MPTVFAYRAVVIQAHNHAEERKRLGPPTLDFVVETLPQGRRHTLLFVARDDTDDPVFGRAKITINTFARLQEVPNARR
jgi:hypothetical protein